MTDQSKETELKISKTEPTIRKALEDAFNGHIIAFTKVYPNAIDELLVSLAFDGFEITRIGTRTPDTAQLLKEKEDLMWALKGLMTFVHIVPGQHAYRKADALLARLSPQKDPDQ